MYILFYPKRRKKSIVKSDKKAKNIEKCRLFQIFGKLSEAELEAAAVPYLVRVRESSHYAVGGEAHRQSERLAEFLAEGDSSREHAREDVASAVHLPVDVLTERARKLVVHGIEGDSSVLASAAYSREYG